MTLALAADHDSQELYITVHNDLRIDHTDVIVEGSATADLDEEETLIGIEILFPSRSCLLSREAYEEVMEYVRLEEPAVKQFIADILRGHTEG